MNYLAVFCKVYRKYTNQSLPHFKPAQYRTYNAQVKGIFEKCFLAGMDWELYLEYIFNLNPLNFQTLSSYNTIDRLALPLPHYWNFVNTHRLQISQSGLLATIKDATTITVSHALQAPTFAEQLSAYNARMAGSVGLAESAE